MNLNDSIQGAFKKVNGTVLGAVLTLAATVAPINEALAKTHIPLQEYIQMQRSGDPGEVHRDYSPYREGENEVDVTINSSEYGRITLEDFNCETLVPYSPPGQNSGQILVTEGAIASIHAGLGARNLNDPEAIKRAMAVLAEGVRVITPNDTNTMRGIDHLNNYHGIDLYRVEQSGGRNHLLPQPEMQNIIGACVQQLNR